MKRLSCCFRYRALKPISDHSHSQISGGNMGNSSKSNAYDGFQSEKLEDNIRRSIGNNSAINIIHNHDFSGGLHSWHPNCCKAFVVSLDAGHIDGKSTKLGDRYAVITNRTECWQGLEQDITSQVSTGSTYKVSARVGVSGALQGSADVQATLKLEHWNTDTSYLFIGRKSVSKESWENLEGTFSLPNMPDRIVFYLEGPPRGVDLLIESVVVSCSDSTFSDGQRKASPVPDEENIISNSKFEDGLNGWSGRGCKIVLHTSMADGKIVPQSGKFFASATESIQTWNGIQQEITGKVKRKLAYEVEAVVRKYGNNVTNADIQATLWVQAADMQE